VFRGGINIMVESEKDSLVISNNLRACIVVVTMGIVALVSPYMFSYTFDYFEGIYVIELLSPIWIHYSNVFPTIIFHPTLLFNNPINTLLRFWFVFAMYRCYMEKSSRRRVVYVGLLGELWQTSIMAFNLIIWRSPIFQLLFVPIPLLLLVGMVILFLIKPPEPPGLWEENEN
jgi:hypothetical protein